jgi:hypothetical protein
MKTGTTGTIGLRIEAKKEFHNVEFVVMKENQNKIKSFLALHCCQDTYANLARWQLRP